ncbi:hypothetical protein [Streptomyces scopuliridis]|uniref:hypothetical protein n=1 Tax=Streptomyces scopuliridis TaxID=452529 RepID=UPI003448A0E7
MANWNLSVELRGQGNDLARALRQAAGEARALGAAADTVENKVTHLGTASATAGGHVGNLGTEARGTTRRLGDLDRNAGAATRTVKKLGTSAETASGRLGILAAQARSAAKDMRKLERALAAADAQIRALANHVRIAVDLDDHTAAGINAVRAAIAELELRSPVTLAARLDDQTGPGAAAVRAAVTNLRALSPIDLNATLDNQTATGIAAIHTSLAGLQALSPLDLRATLDDDTGPGVAAVRTALAELRGLSPVDITARFDGDSAQIAAAATAMGELRDHADSAGTALSALSARAATTAAALNAVQQEAQDASRALRTLRGRAAAAAAALDELGDRARHAATGLRAIGTNANTANGRLTTLSGNTRTLRSDMDDLDGSLTRVNGRLGGLRGSLGTVSNSTSNATDNTKNLIMAAIALGTALIPIAAATVPIAAGLTASGAAIGVFAVAVAGQIVAVNDAAEAEKKYQDAIDEHGRASDQAVKAETEYLRILSEMPPATRESAAALSVLKDQYKDWSDALAGDTMPIVTKSMGVFGAMLPKLTPLVRGTSAELDRLLNVAAGGMSTPGFDRFVKSFTEFATESLARGTSHLTNFIQALNTGEIGSDLRKFLDYAKANAPLVGDTLMNLARAATHLLIAASDMGVGVLQVVNVFAQLVTAIPTGFLSTLLQLYAGFKLVTLGAAALGAVTGSAAVARLGAYFAIMRAAGVSTTLRATAASMTGMQKAAVGLGVLAVAAIGVAKLAENARGAPPDVDRLTTSLKRLSETGKFTGELKNTFGDVDGLVKKIGEIGDAAQANEDYVKSFGNSGIGPLDDLRSKANELWQDFTKGEKSLTALKDDFSALDGAMAGMVSSGYGKQAASDFDMIEKAAKKAGYSTKDIAALFPEYQAAVASAAAEQELAISGMGLFGQQAMDVKTKLDAQKASTDGLRGAIQALNDVNRAALGGMIGFEASIDAAAKAAAENAGSLRMVNGELDLNSPKAQAAATALQDLGAKTDEAATAARASGKSWEYVNGIYSRGEQQLIQSAMAMGLTKAQAQQLAASILDIPDDHATQVEMRTEDAIADLDAVIGKIEATPGAKSVTVNALTKSAMALLESLGYKTETLPDGRVRVTARTGEALGGLAAVKRARDALRDRTITITTHYRITGSGAAQQARRSGSYGTQLANADGNVVDYYAQGGIQRGGVRHFANGGEHHVAQIARAGEWRVWAEDETGGEAYIPLARSKRSRSKAIAEETVRRLGGKGIAWEADGGVNAFASGGFTYTPTTLASLGTQDARGRFDDLVAKLRTAWTEYNAALKSLNDVKKNKKSTKAQIAAAQKKASAEYADVKALDKALGLPSGAKAPTTLNLTAYQKQLTASVAATDKWQKNLAKIGRRGGADVQELLQAMGESGYSLVNQLAGASDKQFKDITAKLLKVGQTAKASLADFTQQANIATAKSTVFQSNLTKLAGMGYGDLAQQLAGQGDEAAQALAAEAVKSPSKAASANTAAKKASSALTSEQVQDLVAIIAAVKTSKTGIHDVAGTTGLGEDIIIEVAGKATAQIKSALGTRASKFLADLARGQKGMSYADGGIRAGMYATQSGIVRFAEPQTGGEAYIPLGASKRGPATKVLSDVAARFGVGLTDASASRPVVIIRQGGDTHVTVNPVRMTESASEISAQVGRQVRRANRGGVAARAGS